MSLVVKKKLKWFIQRSVTTEKKKRSLPAFANNKLMHISWHNGIVDTEKNSQNTLW